MAQDVSNLSKRFMILIGLGVVGAMAFGLAISFYRNLLFEDTLHSLSASNHNLRLAIDDGIELLEYYKSHQYRDKYAKENLARINPDEKVLIIVDDTRETYVETIDGPSRKQQQDAAYQEFLQTLPTIEHWRYYFSDPDALEEIKRSFR